MDIVKFAKKKEKKRHKRKLEIKKRLRCHHNVQSCQLFHPYIEKKIKIKVATQQKEKTWKDLLKEWVKIMWKNMTRFFSKEKKTG